MVCSALLHPIQQRKAPYESHHSRTQPSNDHPTLATAWRELDCIDQDDGDLLTRALDSIAATKAALLSGTQSDCSLLAERLTGAMQDVTATRAHLLAAIETMGEYCLS